MALHRLDALVSVSVSGQAERPADFVQVMLKEMPSVIARKPKCHQGSCFLQKGVHWLNLHIRHVLSIGKFDRCS